MREDVTSERLVCLIGHVEQEKKTEENSIEYGSCYDSHERSDWMYRSILGTGGLHEVRKKCESPPSVLHGLSNPREHFIGMHTVATREVARNMTIAPTRKGGILTQSFSIA